MIVCSVENADTTCNYVASNVNVAAAFGQDLTKLREWREQHYDGIAVLIGDIESIRTYMEEDSYVRHASIVYENTLIIPKVNETIIYDPNAIHPNVSVVLSLDPGEKHLGTAIIKIQNGQVLDVDSFVYDTKAFLNSDLVSDSDLGATQKTNEALMHLIAYAMVKGRLSFVVIENQAAQNTKAAALTSAILMACQMMQIPSHVMAPSVKFTRMGMATPKVYAKRKELSVKIYRDLNSTFKINCPGEVPEEYKNIIVYGEKDDDKADAIFQGLISCIDQRLVSFKVEYLISICKETVNSQAKVDKNVI